MKLSLWFLSRRINHTAGCGHGCGLRIEVWPPSHGEGTPGDCVTSHCQAFGLGDCKVVIVQGCPLCRGAAEGSNSCSLRLLPCHCPLGGWSCPELGTLQGAECPGHCRAGNSSLTLQGLSSVTLLNILGRGCHKLETLISWTQLSSWELIQSYFPKQEHRY